MKKATLILILILFFGVSSFKIHKFYVSIYQINFNQKEKRLEITSRIFIDDLNTVLSKKYSTKTNFSETNFSKIDIDLMKQYVSENFSIKINGASKTINYLSCETETNVLICYYNIKEIQKIKNLEIKNSSLFDLNSDQQNIIQTSVNNKKKSLLLTFNNPKETVIVK